MEDGLKLIREAFEKGASAYRSDEKQYNVGDVITETDDYKIVVIKNNDGNIEAEVIWNVTRVICDMVVQLDK